MSDEDLYLTGRLEHATHTNCLPDGRTIRPADAIGLAARIAHVEEMEGRPANLEDLMEFDRELCSRFARWDQAPNYGALAVLLRDEARRLVSLS